MNKNNEHIQLSEDREPAEQDQFDRERLSKELAQAYETAIALGVPVIVKTPKADIIITPK